MKKVFCLCFCLLFLLTTGCNNTDTGSNGSNSLNNVTDNNKDGVKDNLDGQSSDNSSYNGSSGKAPLNNSSSKNPSSPTGNTGNTSTGNTDDTGNSGGNTDTENPTPPEDNPVINTIGNSRSNLANGGYVAGQGDWVYYANNADNGYLYKMKNDGSSKTKLADLNARSINVIGDWIYFIEKNAWGSPIYKIKTNGNNLTTLEVNTGYDIFVQGDWIYYGLSKIKIDGSQSTQLSSDDASHINVVGDWIYYFNLSNSGKMYKIKTDGTENQILQSSGTSTSLAHKEKVIFFNDRFITLDKNNYLLSYNYNREDFIYLASDTKNFLITDTCILVYKTDDKLYRMNFDRTNVKRIYREISSLFFSYGEYVYYYYDDGNLKAVNINDL